MKELETTAKDCEHKALEYEQKSAATSKALDLDDF